MLQRHTLLLTSTELQLVTALGGVKRALLFQSTATSDRHGQIQAVCRLIRDGFLSQNDRGLAVGPSLLPFVRTFAHASTAIVVQPSEIDVPSLCLYHDRVDQKFAVICPYENRNDTFKLFLADETALIDELEAVHLLPRQRNNKVAVEGAPNNPHTEDDLVVYFERYCLAETSCVDRLSIYRASPTWAMAIDTLPGEKTSYYHRNKFAEWLKGI